MGATDSILTAVKEALEATDAFDEVWAGGIDPRGRPSGELLGVGIEPGPAAAEHLWDSGPAGGPVVTVRAALRVVVRHDGRVLRLLKMWLETPVEETDAKGDRHRTTRNQDEGRGSPQGSPISPLLSNIYMRRFVKGWKTGGHER